MARTDRPQANHAAPPDADSAAGGVVPRICDYEGSPYRSAFWRDVDRDYEDAVERLVLADLIPRSGDRLLEIGAGFGRLVDLYGGYSSIFLLDYAQSMLQEAQATIGDRATYVCADLYRLPFDAAAIDTVVQVRVLHHVEDVPAAFAGVARVLAPGGSYVLEYANKRHLKAAVRYATGRQSESPFSATPHEFVPLNWNFHPSYIEAELTAAGLAIRERRAASHFRSPTLKRVFSARLLARIDAMVAKPLSGAAMSPSQFIRAAQLAGPPPSHGLFRCPSCGAAPLVLQGDEAPCSSCGRRWPRRSGIWIFRADLIG